MKRKVGRPKGPVKIPFACQVQPGILQKIRLAAKSSGCTMNDMVEKSFLHTLARPKTEK